MEECLVCYKEINKIRDCGLELLCGHWHCEKCTNILAEHCSICDRSTLNIQFHKGISDKYVNALQM